MNTKIMDMDELAKRAKQLRASGKKLVATNGCFDLLHVGHVRYLQAARALGDLLAVGLNGDRSVGELKGIGRPINTERDRWNASTSSRFFQRCARLNLSPQACPLFMSKAETTLPKR